MNKQKRTGNVKSGNNIWKQFICLLWNAKLPWLWVILTFLLSTGYSALQLMFPDYTEQIIGGDLSRKTIIAFVAVMLAIAVVNILSAAIQKVTSAKITKNVRKSIWGMITVLPVSRLEEEGCKELISRTTTDTAMLGMIFSSTLPGIVSTVYYVAGSLRSVGEYDSSMSITMIGLIIVQIFISFLSGKFVYKYSNRAQTKLARMTEMVSEVMSNLAVVKIFTAEEREKVRGHRAIKNYNMAHLEALLIGNAFNYLSSLVNMIGTLIVIVWGGVLVNRGTIDIGAWVAYFMYYYYMTYDVQMLPYYWKELKEIQGTVQRLSDISSMEPENTAKGETVVPEKKAITFKDIHFSYGDCKILKGVTFEISPGSKVSIVGKNGAGKTTLINLLERFYQPDSGTITYGEKESDKINLASWRKLFAYVPQDVRLMDGTIRDNLLYGVERAISEQELQEVCRKVKLWDFLSSLPAGIDTLVEDFGGNLSGGQRQKIAIASAILRNAECLILDEYSSNLDLEAQKQIDACIEELRGEKTLIVIAHQFETLQNSDQVVVLSDGRVEAVGNHNTVLKESRVYNELFQAEYMGKEEL